MANVPVLNILIVDTHDVYTIGVADVSFYPPGFNIINPTIEITPPSFNKVTLGLSAKNLTILDSGSLGLDGAILPDGVWKFSFTVSPASKYRVNKHYLRTDNIQREWGNAFLSIDHSPYNSKDAVKRAVLDQIWALIQGAIADANLDNCDEAMNKYRMANEMLMNFKK